MDLVFNSICMSCTGIWASETNLKNSILVSASIWYKCWYPTTPLIGAYGHFLLTFVPIFKVIKNLVYGTFWSRNTDEHICDTPNNHILRDVYPTYDLIHPLLLLKHFGIYYKYFYGKKIKCHYFALSKLAENQNGHHLVKFCGGAPKLVYNPKLCMLLGECAKEITKDPKT